MSEEGARMFVYLVQHAEAKREEEDPSRSLSEKGLRDINAIAAYVAKSNLKIDKIFYSAKLRAKQTAEVLFENLRPAEEILEVDGLAPLDNPDIWAGRLKDVRGNIMLVGHLPHLAKLASLLLCGNAEMNVVSFKMAGIVCLSRDEAGAWSLQWALIPGIVVGQEDVGPCDGL
jgi:phosphohistidine phosphatase